MAEAEIEVYSGIGLRPLAGDGASRRPKGVSYSPQSIESSNDHEDVGRSFDYAPLWGAPLRMTFRLGCQGQPVVTSVNHFVEVLGQAGAITVAEIIESGTDAFHHFS